MNQLTKITLAWELFECGIPKAYIAMQLAVQRETVHLWVKGIQEYGHLEFLERYTTAKRVPRPSKQVDPILKRWVWEIKEREADCCGQKIQYFLGLEHGVKISIPKIYEILKEKYVVKSKEKYLPSPRLTSTQERQMCCSDSIQSDGGPEFKDKFREKVYQYTNHFRVAGSYKKRVFGVGKISQRPDALSSTRDQQVLGILV